MRMRRGPGSPQTALHDAQAWPQAAATRPIVQDEQLANIFRNMRLSLKAPREAIARRLATSPATIESLEAGAIAALPHGKETARIVRAYCELLRLDPEPILWRIQSQLQPPAAMPAYQPPPPPSVAEAIAPRGAGSRAHATTRTEPPDRGRRRRRGRALFALSAPIALAAIVVYLIQLAPKPAYRAVALLPGSIGVPVRAGLDYLIVLTAPQRDGLTWVDVGDPRSRKADKLQPGSR